VCVVVFCDSVDGLLPARRPSDGDDVTMMTSSVSNSRRACSAYENVVYHSDESSVSHQLQVQQEHEADDDEADDDDDPDDTHLPAPAPPSVLAASALGSVTDETCSSEAGDRQDVDVSVRAGRPPVAARRTETRRPTPPVSRVQPIIRHPTTTTTTTTIATAAATAAAADDDDDTSNDNNNDDTLQLKNSAQSPPSVTAHASKRCPVPVPVPRHHTINTVDDIPSSIDCLTVADVAKCVTLLGVGHKQAELMTSHGVDGQQLMKLTISQLTETFQFTPLEANKLARFSRGWRPT